MKKSRYGNKNSSSGMAGALFKRLAAFATEGGVNKQKGHGQNMRSLGTCV